jgi:hypothetical protein
VVQSQTFDDVVADLSDSGAELCVGAAAGPGIVVTDRCGVSFDHPDLTVTLQPPPSFSSVPSSATSPSNAVTVTESTPLSWTSFENGLYLLQMKAVPATAATPHIYVFTSETTTSWPDLSAIGVAFPVGASYESTITGLGPYATTDDALGPAGVGAPFPVERRRSSSPTVFMTTTR